MIVQNGCHIRDIQFLSQVFIIQKLYIIEIELIQIELGESTRLRGQSFLSNYPFYYQDSNPITRTLNKKNGFKYF